MLLLRGEVEGLPLVHVAVHDAPVQLLRLHVPVEVLQGVGELLVAHVDGDLPVGVHVDALLVHLDLPPGLVLLLDLPGQGSPLLLLHSHGHWSGCLDKRKLFCIQIASFGRGGGVGGGGV